MKDTIKRLELVICDLDSGHYNEVFELSADLQEILEELYGLAKTD